MSNRLYLDKADKTKIISFISNSRNEFPTQHENYVEISEEDFRAVVKDESKAIETDASGKYTVVNKESKGLWQNADEKAG